MPQTDNPPEKMTEPAIENALKGLSDWSFVGETIQRTYQFADFVTAMRFVSAVADAAEASRHHPDILIRYSRVTLTLATHDAGGITEKDFALARVCDALAANWPLPVKKPEPAPAPAATPPHKPAKRK